MIFKDNIVHADHKCADCHGNADKNQIHYPVCMGENGENTCKDIADPAENQDRFMTAPVSNPAENQGGNHGGNGGSEHEITGNGI